MPHGIVAMQQMLVVWPCWRMLHQHCARMVLRRCYAASMRQHGNSVNGSILWLMLACISIAPTAVKILCIEIWKVSPCIASNTQHGRRVIHVPGNCWWNVFSLFYIRYYLNFSDIFGNISCIAVSNENTWLTVNCERALPSICEIYTSRSELDETSITAGTCAPNTTYIT